MIPGMKLIDDILKGLPENARLREQLGELRSQIQILQSENEKLRADLAALKPKPDGLNGDMLKVLRYFFDHGRDLSIEDIARQFKFQPSVAEFHFGALMKRGFLTQTRIAFRGGSGSFGLTHAGREYVMEHCA